MQNGRRPGAHPAPAPTLLRDTLPCARCESGALAISHRPASAQVTARNMQPENPPMPWWFPGRGAQHGLQQCQRTPALQAPQMPGGQPKKRIHGHDLDVHGVHGHWSAYLPARKRHCSRETKSTCARPAMASTTAPVCRRQRACRNVSQAFSCAARAAVLGVASGPGATQ
jgi:hypothetical protein